MQNFNQASVLLCSEAVNDGTSGAVVSRVCQLSVATRLTRERALTNTPNQLNPITNSDVFSLVFYSNFPTEVCPLFLLIASHQCLDDERLFPLFLTLFDLTLMIENELEKLIKHTMAFNYLHSSTRKLNVIGQNYSTSLRILECQKIIRKLKRWDSV